MSDTASSASGNARFAAHNVVAIYPTPGDARAALSLLERHGVEGADIELFGPGITSAHEPITNDEQRQADLDATTDVGRRFTTVGVAVALVGIVLGGLLGYLIGSDGDGLVVGAIGGFVVGGLLGFLYGGYATLTINEQWGDTFIGTGETSVAVHSDDQREIDIALHTLRGTDASRLATCGPDGELHDVA